MEIPQEVIEAKDALEGPLFEAGLITGCDIGVRDEESPDENDLALRIFVSDANDVPPGVTEAAALFPFPVVVLQRVFRTTGGLPDTDRERPVLGGVSVAASRLFAAGSVIVGTLGAIVTDAADSTVFYGLGNHHVLCHDINRAQGDEIVQPRPSVLGVLPGDRIGTLERWAFPEGNTTGVVDAAICRLEVDSIPEVKEFGPLFGSLDVTHTTLVHMRGSTTGKNFGWVSGMLLSVPADYPDMPPVGAGTTFRTLTGQILIHIDFPQSVVFGDSGDSGSVVTVTDGDVDRAVGLYWASAGESDGGPLQHGVMTPATVVEAQLNVRF